MNFLKKATYLYFCIILILSIYWAAWFCNRSLQCTILLDLKSTCLLWDSSPSISITFFQVPLIILSKYWVLFETLSIGPVFWPNWGTERFSAHYVPARVSRYFRQVSSFMNVEKFEDKNFIRNTPRLQQYQVFLVKKIRHSDVDNTRK